MKVLLSINICPCYISNTYYLLKAISTLIF